MQSRHPIVPRVLQRGGKCRVSRRQAIVRGNNEDGPGFERVDFCQEAPSRRIGERFTGKSFRRAPGQRRHTFAAVPFTQLLNRCLLPFLRQRLGNASAKIGRGD